MDTRGELTSRREAVQPSLWDRLVDDLPGLVAETDAERAALRRELGDDRAERLLEGGLRALEREADLGEELRHRLHRLIDRLSVRRRLEETGILVTPAVLREAVRRDIEALFNCERLESRYDLTAREREAIEAPAALLEDFPETRRSALNYGVPSFAGRKATDFDRDLLARELKDVLGVFEPRLKRDSIKVKVRFGDKVGLRIEIDGTLMMAPVPERLRLSTTVDLDNGLATTAVEEA